MSRTFEYSSIENKHIIIKRKYDIMKDDINNNIIARISSTYEESSICFQDQSVIDIITGVIENEEYGVYGLLKKVGAAKEKSNIEGYTKTESALSDLNEKIGELSGMLDTLRNDISKKSIEAYDELSSSYAKLNQDYTTACGMLDFYFRAYDIHNATYTQYYNEAKASADADVTLINKSLQAKADRDSDEAKIETWLKKLNGDIKVPLEQLLEDGLKKTNNIGGSNPSVVLPNGISESYIK